MEQNNNQIQVMNPQPKIFESGLIDNYSEKFIDDCYIDAYAEFAKGKSFCMELVVVPVKRAFLKDTTCFKIVVRVFESARELMDFVNEYGSDKIIEQIYINI